MNKYLRLTLVSLVCIYFWDIASSFKAWHFIDNVNLIFHEAGHTIFFFLGEYIQVLAGSAFQIILPLFISIYFFAKNQKISASLCLLWVGQNFLSVAVYSGDAIKMELDLLGGDSVIHDWNYLLSHAGILNYTNIVSGIFYTIGILTIFAGTVFSLYYTWFSEE